MNQPVSRRKFLRDSSIAGAAFWIGSSAFTRGESPNEKLNIGVIGTANRAGSNIAGVKHHNIVAVCDIDDTFLDAAMKNFPQAKRYNDFRKLLEQKDVEAVVVSTADHTHAVATAAALKSGRHVYCEKPLAHDVWEARVVSETAKKNPKLATQMGTQIHAGNNYRRVVELVQSGAIGKISECHVWCSKSKTAVVPKDTPPVPKNVHWDLWLGPAPEHAYNPAYHPKNWRAFWDYGSGTLGDMGCHYMDLAFWALKLRSPLSISAEGPEVSPVVTPPWTIAHWEYASRGDLPAVKVHWYDGGKQPAIVNEIKWPGHKKADGTEAKSKVPVNGVLFVGDKGMLWSDYDEHQLFPEEKFKDFKRPAPFIPDSIGHHEEWIQACKTGKPTTCNFDYAGALSEAVLLGNVAFRVGKKLEWDAANARVKNTRDADHIIRREYRKGWTL